MENLETDDGSFLEATVFLSHFSELPDPRVRGAKVGADRTRDRIVPISGIATEADFRHSSAERQLVLHLLTHAFAPIKSSASGEGGVSARRGAAFVASGGAGRG